MTEVATNLDDLEGVRLKFAPFESIGQFIRWTRTNFGPTKTEQCVQQVRDASRKSKTVNVVEIMNKVTSDVRNVDCSRDGIKCQNVY